MSLDRFYKKLWSIKESIKEDIRSLGDKIQFITPLVFITYSACYLTNHISKVFVASFLVAIIIMSLTKAMFNAPRPYEVDGTKNPELDLDWSLREGNSFVSGHTTSALIGGIFWFQINDFMGFVGVMLGLITGVTRIVAKEHWLRDIIGAAVISVSIYLIDIAYFL